MTKQILNNNDNLIDVLKKLNVLSNKLTKKSYVLNGGLGQDIYFLLATNGDILKVINQSGDPEEEIFCNWDLSKSFGEQSQETRDRLNQLFSL